MGRIDDIFRRQRDEGRTGLMPFVTAGYPSLEITERLLPELDAAGASIIELGIPFSDPIADGPVIAASMHEALEAGVRPAAVLDLVRRVRPRVSAGLVAMVSCSIVVRLGGSDFVAEAADAGIDGFIVPDADLDLAEALSSACAAADLAFAMLIAPTTPEDRVPRLVGLSRGFVYQLARAGITGEQDAAPEISGPLARVRAHTDLPVACGFGISTAGHVAAVTAEADAAIVGSALVRRMGEANDPVREAVRFTEELAGGLARRG